MRRIFLFFLFLCVTSLTAQDEELRELDGETTLLYKKIRRSVVAIRARAPMGRFFGSGTLIGSDGLVLTVTGVAPPNSDEIEVLLTDGSRYKAEVVGYEETNTVVLLRLKGAEGTEHAELGDSEKVKPGTLCFSLADVYHSIVNERQPALSFGVVSGLYRLRYGDGLYKGRVIEFDAAFNQGADGGALFDIRGRVIGLMIQGYSYSKWLGCAIPINQIRYILKDLKEGRKISPKYGLTLKEEPHPDGGVVVRTVERRWPAFRAGIRPGDVIVEFEGERIETWEQLAVELSIVPPATEVEFLIRRDGELKRVRLKVAKKAYGRFRPERRRVFCGIIFEERKGRLVVESVAEDSPAERAGVEEGDILLEIEGRTIKTVEEYQKILNGKEPGDILHLKVKRSDEELDFKLKLVETK